MRAVSLLSSLLVCLSLVSCNRGPSWPVPVPASMAGSVSTRVVVSLPLCAGAETCEEREALCGFLDDIASERSRSSRAAQTFESCGKAPISKLLDALRSPLATERFPEGASSLPKAFREADAYPVEDSSAEAEDRVARALLVNGVFFAFFLGDELREPDDPLAGTYSRLVVFRSYRGLR